MSNQKQYNSFASDNVSCACPEVMDAVVAANQGIAMSYMEDRHSNKLDSLFSNLFETEVSVFPVVSGTAANALALASITPTYGKVFCHEMSHINTDECAAPEFYSGGAKLIPMTGNAGKITAEGLAGLIRGRGNVHAAQPATVSLTQSCETGGVYQLEEIQGITQVAHDNGLNVHMDGARFANGLVSLGVSAAEMTWKSGIDVMSFGGTKNGCLAAEAVIFFKPELAHSFPFMHKRAGHLISKMRFISAQLEAYVSNNVWLRNARHANAMAARLSSGFAGINGVDLPFPVQSNEIFANMPRYAIERLNEAGFKVTEGELDETAPPRFVTAWNTQEDEVGQLLTAVKKAMA
ncbi:MAG: threonine aldolase [Parasphingorhabdus sp.]|jgi:threonine aldolase